MYFRNYRFFSLHREIFSWKISLLVTSEILGVIVNTLTANDKYFLQNSQNFLQPIQMPLSKKEKKFLNFSLHFWNLTSILNILKKKMTFTVDVFPKLQTAKNVRQISEKPRFGTPFNSQDVKGSQTLVKSAWQHFYQIFPSLLEKLSRKMSPLVICELLGLSVN